jgi:ankyrin repeat protein
MRAALLILLVFVASARAEEGEAASPETTGDTPPPSPEGEEAPPVEKPKDIPKGVDTSSWNPLHFASWSGNVTAVMMLLASSEFHLEQKEQVFGMTPLILASYRGHKMIVKKLLGAGAYPLVTCKKGKSPLEYATGKDHKGVVILLEKAVKAALTPEEEVMARNGAFILLIVAGIFCIWQMYESTKMTAPPLTRSQKEAAKLEKERRKEKDKRKSEKKAKKLSEKKEKKEKPAEAEEPKEGEVKKDK